MASNSGKIKVPSVCAFYNQKGCSKKKCTFLHLCKGFLDSTCEGCTLSHDIKAEQPLSVLSACGFNASQNAEILLEMYTVRMCRTQQATDGPNPVKLDPPSICSYYNLNKCQKSDCTYVHICENYVYNCCELENCQLSHDLKEGQAWNKLSLYGFDTNKSPEEIRKEYMKMTVRTKKKQSGKTQKENEETQYPYLICKNYNQNKCHSTHCKYLHICGKFILDECESKCPCPNNLNHRLFHLNNKAVLNGAGYDTDQNEFNLLKEYKRKSQKMFAKWKQQQNQPSENKKFSRQESNQSTGSEANESTSKKNPYLVCRNFNTKGCSFEKCKWLHICGDFIVGRCEKGHSCKTNHNLFFANNKNVLGNAGFDTEKTELELFIDYRLRLKDFESAQNDKLKQGKEKDQIQAVQATGHEGSIEKSDWRKNKRGPVANENKSKERPGSAMDNEKRKQHSQAESKNKSQTNRSKSAKGETHQSNVPKDAQQSKGKDSKPGITKTIIQSEDTDICRSNIRERCKYGEKCNRHHCSLPYHWQFKVPTQPWKSFPNVVNETLEMNFCDKDIDSAIVAVANDRCVVDFNQMKGKMKDGELSLRRLSTSSACEAPPGETLITKWIWYWKHDNGSLRLYGNESQGDSTGGDIGREIEEKYIEDPEATITVKIGSYQYQIDFKNMKQSNTESKKEWEIRRRPEYRSKEDVEKEAKERRKISRKVDLKQSTSQQQSGGLPTHWSDMNDEDEEMRRILLPQSGSEYMDVFKVFLVSLGRSDLVVDSIERIQNPFLWQNYEWKKRKMEKHNKSDGVNELQLFHGTSAENVEPISRTNFDWRLYGSAVGSIYGQGSYFAADAKYSDSGYAQHDKDGFKWMFIVKVLAGKTTKGTPDLRRPPPLDPASPKGRLYDSTVDNPNKPRIYCIFDNSQYYPDYIIKYRY